MVAAGMPLCLIPFPHEDCDEAMNIRHPRAGGNPGKSRNEIPATKGMTTCSVFSWGIRGANWMPACAGMTEILDLE
jgi:hypothetical protein